MKRPHWIALVILLCVGGFAFGMAKLLHVRMERGDIYPRSSSLRVDPLGTRALADSLDSLPGIETDRNYRHWRQVDLPNDATLYILHAHPVHLFDRDDRAPNRLLEFTGRGGRLVWSYVSFYRDFDDRFHELDEDEEEEIIEVSPIGPEEPADPGEAKQETESDEDAASDEKLTVDIKEMNAEKEKVLDPWDMSVSRGDFDPQRAKLAADIEAPGEIVWNDDSYFTEFTEDWTVVYETTNGPVVLMRAYGKGEIIALADPYLLSNEALMLDREAAWLGWLHGDSAHAIFDEWHLGLQEPSGVTILMKRYRLGGLALGLLALTALFVWRNLYSLTPIYASESRVGAGVVRLSGSTHTGLRNLLKRAIPPVDLLPQCVGRFQQLGHRLGRMSGWKDALPEIHAVMVQYSQQPARKRRPVQAYRDIVHILTKYRIHLR